jgi:hypothetical protein
MKKSITGRNELGGSMMTFPCKNTMLEYMKPITVSTMQLAPVEVVQVVVPKLAAEWEKIRYRWVSK